MYLLLSLDIIVMMESTVLVIDLSMHTQRQISACVECQLMQQ